MFFVIMIKKYRQFYEAYKNKLFRYLMFRCSDYEVSSDIMQESFARHYQFSSKSNDFSPALLFTIARNALVDCQRQNKNNTLFRDDVPQVSQDLEADFIIREECEIVAAGFKKLPREYQEVLELAVSGLRYRQIGVILGLSESNIKVKVHRARVRLREIIKNGENR